MTGDNQDGKEAWNISSDYQPLTEAPLTTLWD
jgi:hypothetical protein